jgi:TolA-binding protein
MTRRITLLFVILLLCASSAWPKFKDEELKQLDDKFQPLMDQLQAMQVQIQTLNTQLQQLKDNQTQLQTFIVKQQRALNEINQMVSSMRLGGEDHYSKLKGLLDKLSTDTQASFNKISPGAGGGGTTPAFVSNPQTPTLPPKPTDHYVTAVNGNDVVVDLTSADGIQQGTRLGLYKASDPSTRVGLLEVTQVMDSASRARVMTTINASVKAEFGDSVRVEK